MIHFFVELAALLRFNLQNRKKERADGRDNPIGPYEAFKRLGDVASNRL